MQIGIFHWLVLLSFSSFLCDIDPTFIHQLQVPLDSGRTVLRALSVHPMWKIHHKTILNTPFALARSQIIVNDDLSSIGEVTELSFPDCQSVWIGQGIAVIKP